jgi:F-type H+-transporting ATPase subunit a
MADPILHIKDSFYFEVPKVFYPCAYRSAAQFPDVWVSLDAEFQQWSARRLLRELADAEAGLPSDAQVLADWEHWVHADHANFAKPLHEFLSEMAARLHAEFVAWKQAQIKAAKADAAQDAVAAKEQDVVAAQEKATRLVFDDYLARLEEQGHGQRAYFAFLKWHQRHGETFQRLREKAAGPEAIRQYKSLVRSGELPDWSQEKIAAYNGHLSGKVLIPQPFATLRNLYEKESGFAISKYLILEVAVGLILVVLFSRLARHLERGGPPRGKLWNLLEAFLVFIRDQIVRPTIGSHEHDHHAEPGHASPAELGAAGDAAAGHGGMAAKPEAAHAVADHHGPHAHGAHGGRQGHGRPALEADPASRLLPLFWTIFFFVLGCNLMGMVPWAGAPTSAFAVTFAMACVTFATVVVCGMTRFGPLGFFLNQIPSMDLPLILAAPIRPMILAIELLGLIIKHLVLSIRLLANMVAGHLVLLGVMGLAFGAEAALRYAAAGGPGWQWWLTAAIAVLGSAAFSCLELFVAFLQAYIFTFLSALFVGAAMHKH